MTEEYSLEKFRNAKRERLDPRKRERLEELRALKEHWKTAPLPGDPQGVLKYVQSLRYAFGRAMPEEHAQLEVEHEKTKEGQLELAHAEGHILNDTFDARAEQLENALAHKDDSPQADAEYRLSLSRFNEFVEDLGESDLERYASDIRFKRAGVLDFKKGVDADPWHPTPEAQETKLLELLMELPDGPYAHQLYQRLQNPRMNEGKFFDAIYTYRERMMGQQFDRESMPHIITKDLGKGRLLQVKFYDNGYIIFNGRDPEHDKKFSSDSGSDSSTGYLGPSVSDLL